jgi:two-component system cell cycle response regulator
MNSDMNKDIKILIVEDSPTQAEQLKATLEEQNYKVEIAYNGKEALTKARTKMPHVIISDIIMPEMDGYQFCEKVKEDEHLKDIPVILLTSLSEPSDVIKGLKCKADNFIIKPYNKEFLLSRIHHVLLNTELRKNHAAEMVTEFYFANQKYLLTAERLQIIDLLLSTYENAIQQKSELEKSYLKLQKAHETIKILEKNYRNLLESNADAMVVINKDSIIRYVNPAAAALFNRNVETFPGQKFDYPVIAGEIREINIPSPNGDYLTAEVRVVETNWEGENAYLATFRDVTDNVKLREKLRTLSLTDELTGLYNRRGFYTQIQQYQETFNNNEGLLLYIDIDFFKKINDTLGHNVGDMAIVDTANIIKKSFRESDIIGRIGGDEFAVFIAGANIVNHDVFLERLYENLHDFNTTIDRQYKLSLSVGKEYNSPDNPFSINELIIRADRSMYEQKRSK